MPCVLLYKNQIASFLIVEHRTGEQQADRTASSLQAQSVWLPLGMFVISSAEEVSLRKIKEHTYPLWDRKREVIHLGRKFEPPLHRQTVPVARNGTNNTAAKSSQKKRHLEVNTSIICHFRSKSRKDK
jgi:hypothetical protein